MELETGGTVRLTPPPPPSSLHKYILTIPIEKIPNIGFKWEPRGQSDTGEMMGAQISQVDLQMLNSDSDSDHKYLHRIRVGDTLYRINGELVKDATYRYISSLLFSKGDVHSYINGRCIREDGSKATITLMMERQDRNRRNYISFNESALPCMIPHERNPLSFNRNTDPTTSELTGQIHTVDLSKTPNPKPHSTLHILPSPSELSEEGNVLSSIFSSKNYNVMMLNQSDSSSDVSSGTENNCAPMNKNRSNLDSCEDIHHNLLVIPEEQSVDGDASSDDDAEYFKSSCTALKSDKGSYHYEKTGNLSSNLLNGHSMIDPCPSSPVLSNHDNDEHSNEDGIASPTLSYSVTTVNTEQHIQLDTTGPCNFLSPLGLKISDHSSFESESESVVSRRQFYDARVNKLRRKYSFLSPESCKDPTGMEVSSKSCAMSCSMSTVYMSPILNISAGVEPYLPVITETQDHGHMIPKNISVTIEKSIDSDNDTFDEGNYQLAEESLHIHQNLSQEVVEDMDAIVIAHAELQDRMEAIMQEREHSEELLKSQIESLETQVKELKSTMKDQAVEYSSRIESLEQSKAQAEKDMDDFRLVLENTTMDAESLAQQLQEKEVAIAELSRKLYKECAAAEACANALAKALAVSEHELLCMKEANELSEIRISALEKELQSSRILVEELTNDVERYKAREKDFEKFKQKCKNATHIYKSRIKGLKDIIIERRAVAINVVSQELDSDIQNKENDEDSSKSPQIYHEKENLVQVSTSFHIHADHESDIKEKNPIVSPSNLSLESHEITVRQSKIRAAGGRAALRAKLNLRRKNKSVSENAPRSALKPYNINIRS